MKKNAFRYWLGRSLAIALLVGSGQHALAQPSNMPMVSNTNTISTDLIAAMPNALENMTWQLVSYYAADGSTIEAFGDQAATFLFEDGRVTGTTGCNRFFSSYSLEDNLLSITPGGSTLMACIDETLAAQELAIMAGLPQVTSYVQSQHQLMLLNNDGTTLFTLTPQPTAELTDTEWTLTVYNNGHGGLTTPILDTTITAQFDTAGSIVGSAGCNRYRASFESDGDNLTIGPAASTRRLCSQPEGVMAQESAFLALLENAASYAIAGNQLTLTNAAGTTLAQFSTAF